jgi:hypothetical protein
MQSEVKSHKGSSSLLPPVFIMGCPRSGTTFLSLY